MLYMFSKVLNQANIILPYANFNAFGIIYNCCLIVICTLDHGLYWNKIK